MKAAELQACLEQLEWCDLDRLALADRGEAMRPDGDESLLTAKLVDNAGLGLSFTYGGSGRRRHVVVDGLFGASLDQVEYIRGYDDHAREYRSFKTDRIDEIYLANGWALSGQLDWFMGQAIRARMDLPTTACPRSFQVGKSVEITTRSDFSGLERFQGQFEEAEISYRGGQVIRLTINGRPLTGGRLRRFTCNAGPGAYGRVVVDIREPGAETIPDLLFWLESLAGPD